MSHASEEPLHQSGPSLAGGSTSFRRAYIQFENVVSYYIPGAIVFLSVAILCLEIFLRTIVGTSILGVVEIVELSMVVITFIGIGGIQRDRGHIRMDLLVNKFMKRRVGPIVEAVSMFLTLLMFGVFTYATAAFALSMFQQSETTNWLRIPLWSAGVCLPIGSFLLCVRCVTQMIGFLKMARLKADAGESTLFD